MKALNLHEASFSDQERKKFKELIAQARKILDFGPNLSDDERKSLPKIGKRRLAFVDRFLKRAAENRNVFPEYFSIGKVENHFDVADAMLDIEGVVRQLLEVVVETRMIFGSQAYRMSLQGKGLFEEANISHPGLDAIVDELAEFFEISSADDAEGGDGGVTPPGLSSPDSP